MRGTLLALLGFTLIGLAADLDGAACAAGLLLGGACVFLGIPVALGIVEVKVAGLDGGLS